jgi:hypothetical protein
MGVLKVFILNDLVAPLDTKGVYSDTTAPVQVNVYVRCADDFSFNMGGGNSGYTTSGAMQEPWQVLQVFPTMGSNHEVCETIDLFSASTVSDKDDSIFFGESIVSLRQLMKRYTVNKIVDYKTTTQNTIGIQFRFPLHGYTHNVAMNPTGNFVTWNSSRVCNTYFSFIRPMYLTLRGGFRNKIQLVDYSHDIRPEFSNTYLTVGRFQTMAETVDSERYTNHNSQDLSTLRSIMVKGQYGTELTLYSYSPVVEVESPWYSSRRFHLACNPATDESYNDTLKQPGDPFAAGSTDTFRLLRNYTDVGLQGLEMFLVAREAQYHDVVLWGAAAEDTTLAHLIGVPGMYTFTNPE